ncbi:MAG: hypothetical protein O8C66_16175 [Candidatus Methanoperedens sp.]|nr:hypothetical protein [Candidatus Methanoperedens sp.]MCZ7372033.1 hypothetical protein [Candidatus Methanoperedens sp.]
MFNTQIINRKFSIIRDINSYRASPAKYKQMIHSGKSHLDNVYDPLNPVIRIDRGKIRSGRHAEIHNRRARPIDFKKKKLRVRVCPDINNLTIGDSFNDFYSPVNFNIKKYITKLETKHSVDDITTLGSTTHEENLEYDVFIQMPPIKKWTARVKIKSIENAKMNIVEP